MLRPRSGLGRCGTTPILRRTSTGLLTTSAPATDAAPEVAATRVVRIPSVVVFPAPFGPSSPKNSPSLTVRSRLWSATMSAPGVRGGPCDTPPGEGGHPEVLPRRFGVGGAG